MECKENSQVENKEDHHQVKGDLTELTGLVESNIDTVLKFFFSTARPWIFLLMHNSFGFAK